MEDNRLPENMSTEKRDGLEGSSASVISMVLCLTWRKHEAAASGKGHLGALLIADKEYCVYTVWRGVSFNPLLSGIPSNSTPSALGVKVKA